LRHKRRLEQGADRCQRQHDVLVHGNLIENRSNLTAFIGGVRLEADRSVRI
jgi:hypothetical protein